MGKGVLALFALGALALIVGVGIGGLAGDLQQPQTDVYFQSEGQADSPTDRLTIVLNDVNATADPSTVQYTMIDTDTSQRQTQSANVSEKLTFNLADRVNATAEIVQDNSSVRTAVDTPRTYGWNDRTATIATNLPFLMLLAGGFSIVGGMIAVGVEK